MPQLCSRLCLRMVINVRGICELPSACTHHHCFLRVPSGLERQPRSWEWVVSRNVALLKHLRSWVLPLWGPLNGGNAEGRGSIGGVPF